MPAHSRMHAVGADQEIALGAAAVGEVRDDGLVGAVLDARPAAFRSNSSTFSRQALSRIASLSVARHMLTAGWPKRCFMFRLIEPSWSPDCE